MNNVALVGRLVADPEIKYTNGGNSIGKFRIAVDRKIKNQNGQDTDFISCLAFGKTAEFLEKYFCKGMRIGLTGRIQTGSYDDRDGKKVYTTDIVAENVEFVESKQAQQGQQQGGQQSAPSRNAVNADEGFMNIPDGIDEELPFA